MKKRTVLALLVALGLSLSACGKEENGASSKEDTKQTTQEQTGEVSDESSSQTDTGSSEEQTGREEVTGWSSEMETVKKAITDALGENYWPNYQIPAQMLEDTYGVSEELYDDYMAEMPMISTNVDTIIIIKAKEGKMEEVEDALEAYREKMVNDTMQYPMNLGKIQASRIEVEGDYVCFVQLGGDTTHVSEEGDEAVIEFCQEQNEIVLEVISSVIRK